MTEARQQHLKQRQFNDVQWACDRLEASHMGVKPHSQNCYVVTRETFCRWSSRFLWRCLLWRMFVAPVVSVADRTDKFRKLPSEVHTGNIW